MDTLLSRYRNLTILLVVVLAQLFYVAYQVRTNRDERLIRVWAVTAVTPMAGVVEALRRNTIGFLEDYFILLDVREQNRRLHAENNRLKFENTYFRTQLNTADRARALSVFEAKIPSKTVAARVIGNSTVATAKAVFVDRGATSGIESQMAVVTPDGIVGKVVAVYPLVSQVLLVTDSTFKVGVESQKSHIHGVLNCGSGACVVEQIQNEEKVDVGDFFYTSGEDRIFPKGFPVGRIVTAQPGQGMKDVRLNLSATPGSAEEVLIVLEGVHQMIPDAPPLPVQQLASAIPPPPPDSVSPDPRATDLHSADSHSGDQHSADSRAAVPAATEADKIRQQYQELGKNQDHVFGAYGSKTPDFNVKSPAQKQNEAAKSTSAVATPPVDGDTPPKTSSPGTVGGETVPASRPPQVLGARPESKILSSKPATAPQTQTAIPPKAAADRQSSGPVLPLGAPRHRTTPSTGSNPASANSAPAKPAPAKPPTPSPERTE